ncbi:eukaryotic elongation factor 2 kinase [Skeletonema marinoi]|uniref:Eukaryotic elongation factor 2 kinase n=1 Tax=Skeletonema marinoi TaxID=267567 RepID=A0AAD9DDI3_9STRA|nr:eukaryotic elongation factor 2 kinase [Skeletonema marinoi]
MTVLSYDRETVRKSLRQKIRRAAATAIHQEDVWAKYKIEDIPAERVVRHIYNPETRQFLKNETIVKIEKEPFTNGAMRHCFRLKKLATPPQSATNHRFHSYGWSRALNYVAKCYLNEQGEPDTNERDSVLTDIILQYEAAHWADKYNVNAPKKIDFIRAYALEFVDRPGSPMFAVERFIAGKDTGCGFLKHNTNSGFVDQEVRRQTPQVFSAHSFYASQGNRLVADIQGVGDLYTDPQVLSVDYRFGDGDLGPRGWLCSSRTFGIRKHQAKYEDDESTLSEGSPLLEALISKFRMLDDNRQMRKSILVRPIDLNCTDSNDTEKRNNFSDVSKTIRRSIVASKKKMAGYECGGLKPRHRRNSEDDDSNLRDKLSKRKSAALMKVVSPPMEITDETKSNLGKVHYHLAYLHGQDRFPQIVCPDRIDDDDCVPPCHAASLANSQACLALARARVGLQSSASPLLHTNVPIDFDSAKDLCRRAMASERAPASPKAAAGCLLYQILEDEETTGDVEKLHVLEETLNFLNLAELEQAAAKEHVKK